MILRQALRRVRRSSRGQSVVELALIAPILLLLLLITVDFGRIFMGWVELNNMARVAANYAAQHEDTWPVVTTKQIGERAQYEALIDANKSVIDCTVVKPAGRYPDPTFGVTRDPGDLVSVTLNCNFTVIAPLISSFLPNPVVVTSSAKFPITKGCLSGCDDVGGGASSTPPPTIDNCRTVPTLTDLSVAGAKAAWVAAGFVDANFNAPANSDTRTVSTQTVVEPAGADPCSGGKVFVFSSVTVTLKDLVTPKPAGCEYVPDVRGMTVADGRAAWLSLFTGAFAPATGQDAKIIDTQATNPVGQPGDCLPPTASMDVTYVDPPPPPPAQPCPVPSLVNTSSTTAVSFWTSAGFAPANLTFKHSQFLPYTIKTQTLIGNTYWPCNSAMQVDDR
jgi:Flp pilus assembly protein TadG